MRKLTMILFVLIMVLIPKIGHAHPPSDIELSYDFEKQMLFVKMRHTTIDARKDYIRKMEVFVNDKEITVMRYTIQPNTIEFSENLPLPAKEGDMIKIKAYSKVGGSSEAAIQVPKKKDQNAEAEPSMSSEEPEVKEIKKPIGSGY